MIVLQLRKAEPTNGYDLTQRICAISRDTLGVNAGSLYLALYRLDRRGLVRARWAEADNGRRAKVYSVTEAGRADLADQRETWARFAGAMAGSFVSHDTASRTRWFWLRSMVGRAKAEREMHEEMQTHLDARRRAFRCPRHVARRARIAAQREFGNVAVIQDESRVARGTRRASCTDRRNPRVAERGSESTT